MSLAASKRRRPKAAAAHNSSASLAAKRPGAWRDVPLPANSPTLPYYVRLPARLCVVNATPAQLRAELASAAITTTPAGSQVTVPLPTAQAQTTLRDLTRAVLDRTLANLHSPTALAVRVEAFIAPPPLQTTVAARLAYGNRQISGNGTIDAPFICSSASPLYLTAPVTLSLVGAAPDQIDLLNLFGLSPVS